MKKDRIGKQKSVRSPGTKVERVGLGGLTVIPQTLSITMATLTYDPTPADQPEFTEDELNSIEVGEQLAQQQEQLLAVV